MAHDECSTVLSVQDTVKSVVLLTQPLEQRIKNAPLWSAPGTIHILYPDKEKIRRLVLRHGNPKAALVLAKIKKLRDLQVKHDLMGEFDPNGDEIVLNTTEYAALLVSEELLNDVAPFFFYPSTPDETRESMLFLSIISDRRLNLKSNIYEKVLKIKPSFHQRAYSFPTQYSYAQYMNELFLSAALGGIFYSSNFKKYVEDIRRLNPEIFGENDKDRSLYNKTLDYYYKNYPSKSISCMKVQSNLNEIIDLAKTIKCANKDMKSPAFLLDAFENNKQILTKLDEYMRKIDKTTYIWNSEKSDYAKLVEEIFVKTDE